MDDDSSAPAEATLARPGLLPLDAFWSYRGASATFTIGLLPACSFAGLRLTVDASGQVHARTPPGG